MALGLRLAAAHGRDFRLELERALKGVDVSIFLHTDCYRPGRRRSPRIDLLPLPEGRYPKLHAKVAILRFVAPDAPELANQVIRLVVGSANLTAAGYRKNIEVAASVEDTPDRSEQFATAVRDAVNWIEQLISPSTEQVARQFRDLKAVFASRPVPRRDMRLRFVGLPSTRGFPHLVGSQERAEELTIVSPFWPSGDDCSDVATGLRERCGGRWHKVRLIGRAHTDEQGQVWPEVPAALVRAVLRTGAKVEVAAANPSFGCVTEDQDDEGEFDEVLERRRPMAPTNRELHAKVLLAVGDKNTRLAIGSFNLTRKGLGLGVVGNVEAGLLWVLPNDKASCLHDVVAFATDWCRVTREPEEFVVEPRDYEGDDKNAWPAFICSLRATRDQLHIKGDAATWPSKVVISMKDIRSRLLSKEEWFDPWTVRAPTDTDGIFSKSTSLTASWWNKRPTDNDGSWPTALPDLEATVSWNGTEAILPVTFEDKHLLPVVEPRTREDEQSLVAWFLGLRPAVEADDRGFGHSIDPLPDSDQTKPDTGDILSYLVRDFVHALPGIRNSLADAGVTETGLRAALLGQRSPVELARQSVHAYRHPQRGKPRKTAVATVFQLMELLHLMQAAALPELADGVSEDLRDEAIAEVSLLLEQVTAELQTMAHTEVVRDYLGLHQGCL